MIIRGLGRPGVALLRGLGPMRGRVFVFAEHGLVTEAATAARIYQPIFAGAGTTTLVAAAASSNTVAYTAGLTRTSGTDTHSHVSHTVVTDSTEGINREYSS